MKGVMFNVIEEIVTDHFGPDTWDDLLEAAAVDGVYTSLGNYDDEDLAAIVSAASQVLSLSIPDVLRFVGEQAFPKLAARYPDYPEGLDSSRALLHRLDDVIHPQVLSLYPGARPPEFDAIDESASQLDLVYRSTRGLCFLAEGLVRGAASAYDESVEVTQSSCTHDGAEACRIHVSYRDG